MVTGACAHRVSLSVSVVSYAPDPAVLHATLSTLQASVAILPATVQCSLVIVDNGPGEQRVLLETLLQPLRDSGRWLQIECLSGHGNVGYGRGHNLAWQRTHSDYHLVLNPDVQLQVDALAQALEFLQQHPDVGLLAPLAYDQHGQLLYLCKAYPSLAVLLVRGFAPAWLKRWFKPRLAAYELRERIGDQQVVRNIPLISGCFMLFRYPLLHQLGGFDPSYFLYFEDYDLSLRAAKHAQIAYVPQVRITHLGGHAARKGWRHIGLFFRSLVSFFNQHGWRWL